MLNICYRHFCVDGSRGVEVDIFVASKLIGENFLLPPLHLNFFFCNFFSLISGTLCLSHVFP
ncbi:unnamed protein product [Trifolium pratense]|uniref:Uncharacterized protein n=1 Tax=Trifolium pratense TaxID=57577 RepID=A0ACB0IQC1_TRIPR|nr:unnamed protein product [Trifolium pratense]